MLTSRAELKRLFRDRLGDIRSRRATVSSPLRHGALAYLSKKLASVSGHSRCGGVAQLAVLAGGPLTPGLSAEPVRASACGAPRRPAARRLASGINNLSASIKARAAAA